MDDLTRFFPVVPRNVPSDNLDSYLRMYADEAGAFRASQRSSGEAHAERFVNTRMPVMRTLQGLGLVGQPIGQDPTALVNRQAGLMFVNATWAQRAANAALVSIGASPIQVDGVIGGETIRALRFLTLRYVSSMTHTAVEPDTGQATVGGLPMPTRSGSGVGIAVDLGNDLATLRQVADPAPTARPPSTPADTSLPDGTPLATAAGTGIIQGIGLLALIGIGAYAISRAR